MPKDTKPEALKDILKKPRVFKKAPAYQWQELALRVIDELRVPNNKRSAVFKIVKQHSKPIIERALNDTKELSTGQEPWRYFFKVIDNLGKPRPVQNP